MSVHLQMVAVNTPVSIPSSRFTVSAGKDTLLRQIKQLVKVKLVCICPFLMQCLPNFAVSKLLGPNPVNFVLKGTLKQQRRRRLRKRHLKVNSLYFKLYRAYSNSSNSSNVGTFFWSWILKDCIKVQEKKKKVVVSCSCPREKVNLGVLSL